MSVKEKTVTDNLTQKQRYKKFISKDTKISKVLNSEAVIFKVILYHDKSGCMFIINLVYHWKISQ